MALMYGVQAAAILWLMWAALGNRRCGWRRVRRNAALPPLGINQDRPKMFVRRRWVEPYLASIAQCLYLAKRVLHFDR